MTFAVIKTGGKQYRVKEGGKIKVEKLSGVEGSPVVFDKVLLTVDGGTVKVGQPTVAGVSVTGKVVRQDRHDKVIIFKYHSKTRRRKMKGHRQHFTEVEIMGISDK